MGGEILVDSQPDQGTRFTFHIKIKESTPVEEVHASLPDLQGIRVLLAEDNELNQQVAVEILKHVGVEVVVANNGYEAVEQLQQENRFSLILMDLQMPGMDGFEATRQIREQLGHEKLPIVAMTANVMKEDRDRAAEIGMDDFLFKPIDVDELYRIIIHYADPEGQTKPVQPAIRQGKTWPTTLPGLNVEEGVGRVIGDQALYLDVVTDFVAQGREQIELLQSQFDHRQWNEARITVHTLRGVAANIGAHEILQEAAEVEKRLRQSEAVDQAQIDSLRQQMEVVASSVEQLSALEESEIEQIATSGQHDEEMDHLLLLLEQNNLDAEEQFKKVRHSILQQLGEASLTEMDRLIDSFDFQAARNLLRTEMKQDGKA